MMISTKDLQLSVHRAELHVGLSLSLEAEEVLTATILLEGLVGPLALPETSIHLKIYLYVNILFI